MIYKISIKDVEKILNSSRDLFVVNDNIKNLFHNYSFYKFSDSVVVDNLIPALKELATKTRKKESTVESVFEKHKLDTSIFLKKSIPQFYNLIEDEIDNLSLITWEDLPTIKDALYKKSEVATDFVVVNGNEDVRVSNQVEICRLASLLLSQGCSIKKDANNNILVDSKSDNNYVYIESSVDVSKNLPSAVEVFDFNKESKMELDVFSKGLDFNLFSTVLTKYLGESNISLNKSYTEQLEILRKGMLNSSGMSAMKNKLQFILSEGGSELFENVDFVKSYIELAKSMRDLNGNDKDSFYNVEFDKLSEGISQNGLPFVKFSKNEKIRKMLVNELPVEDFIFIPSNSIIKDAKKNGETAVLESLISTMLSQMIGGFEKNKIVPDGNMGKDLPLFNHAKKYLSNNDNVLMGEYISTILREYRLNSFEYMEKLKDFFYIDKKDIYEDEYQHIYHNMNNEFEVAVNLTKLLSKLYEPNSKFKESDLNVIVDAYYMLEDNDGNSSNIIKNKLVKLFMICKEFIKTEEYDTMYRIQGFETKVVFQYYSEHVKIKYYQEIFGNFLSGSVLNRDDILLGMSLKKYIENKESDNQKVNGYLYNALYQLPYLDLNVNGNKISSKEEVVGQLFNSESAIQKRYSLVIFFICHKIAESEGVDWSFELCGINKDEFNSYFLQTLNTLFEEEPEQVKLIRSFNLLDMFIDKNEDGTWAITKNNKDYIGLFMKFDKDFIISQIPGNKDFWKSPEVMELYTYDLLNTASSITSISELWNKIYEEVGSDFYNDLWKNRDVVSLKKDDFKGFGQEITVTSFNPDVEKQLALVKFLYRCNLKEFSLEKEVVFDVNFIEALRKINVTDNFISAMPIDYFSDERFIDILTLPGLPQRALKSIPVECVNSPQNILKILKSLSKDKLDVLSLLSPELYNYCASANVDEQNVVERLEVVFNTMLLEKSTVKHEQPKKSVLKM